MHGSRRHNQSGLVIILFTIALTVLLGFAALAIDLNHVVLNKARLQNGVDAAALAAAVVADSGQSESDIANAALDAVKKYASASGNGEISVTQNQAITGSGSSFSIALSDSASLLVQLSNDPTQFPASTFQRTDPVSGDFNDIYVRVQVSGVALDGFFLSLFNLSKSVSSSAVAGPSSSVTRDSQLCNLVPMAVCAKDKTDTEFGGYENGDFQTLKESSWGESDFNTPGNFQLLNFSGKGEVDEQLAGGFDGCLSDGTVDVSTGGAVGLVKKGLNTRFGVYQDNKTADEYPPDIYVKEGDLTTDDDGNITSDFTYSDYIKDIADGNYTEQNGGEEGRRLLSVPIIDCSNNIGSGGGNGANAKFNVVSVGCFFLTKQAPQSNGQGTNQEPQKVYGEFNQDCLVNNATFPTTPSASGAYKIQLYKDPTVGSGV
ncbi:pilus assembly protein TadG-related protein [Vibrio breoganii]|uniref:Tad domain-containing protein n=1 Tax=Vibrio breoganii TaxID=553239 RepID=UPI000C822789|nr:Tad domain-containing protein [Vibrio breoganii]PMJ44517.1 hypothetical protein BCU21_01915 [Vibrio breoganii]PMK51763.1 hypothetical protein BCT97_01295 [Vibrio breoganii]PMO26934.1 hypothetical protein BCT13_03875 [Vibrio breoganii]PMO28460.1 hypothetical protein BCT14_09395 [Vibrio breoganii]PMO66876.1 hypothetical protein BCT05_07910 [Vibrio breoganii]